MSTESTSATTTPDSVAAAAADASITRSAAKARAWKATEIAKATETAKTAEAAKAVDAVAAPPRPDDKTPRDAAAPRDVSAVAAEIRALVGDDPHAAHTLQELVKNGNFVGAFKNLRAREKDLAARERAIAEADTAKASWQRERDEWADLRRRDPKAFVLKSGVTFRELAEHEASQEPEWKRELAAAKAEIDGLKTRLQEREEERARETSADEQAERETIVEQAVRAAADEFHESKDAYPSLFSYFEDELGADGQDTSPAAVAGVVGDRVWEIMVEHARQTGERLAPAEVFKALDDRAKKRYDRIDGRRQASRPEAVASDSERGNGAGPTANPAAQDAPTSLSGRLTADRGNNLPPPTSRREARDRAWAAAQAARPR